eukprot:6297696-Amphidinium_carterae.1
MGWRVGFATSTTAAVRLRRVRPGKSHSRAVGPPVSGLNESWAFVSDASGTTLHFAFGVVVETHPRVVAFMAYNAFSSVVAAWFVSAEANQMDDTAVGILDADAVATAYQRYKERMGAYPDDTHIPMRKQGWSS